MNIEYGRKVARISFIVGFILFTTLPLETTALEKPLPIFFSHLNSPNENSSLSGSCSGDTSSVEIDCYFVQTRISLKTDPTKLSEEIRKITAEMEKAKKDTKALYKNFCADVADKNKRDQANRKLRELEHTAPLSSARLREMLSICGNPSYDKILNFTKKLVEHETRTCKIYSYSDFTPLHLKKIGPNKWLGTEGPSGLCNVVTTWTLEHEPTYNSLWTYTQIRSHADQTNEFCKGLEVGIPLIYSWKNKSIEMKCDFIEFGL